MKTINTTKFNIGDDVIRLSLDYFKNPYHFKKCVENHVVKDADNRFFSVYGKLPYNTSHDLIHQENGIASWGNEKSYHREKDNEVIISEIKKAISDYDLFCIENDKNRKQSLLNEIEKLKIEIAEIDKGNGNWKVGFTVINNKDYREKVISSIKAKFDFEI